MYQCWISALYHIAKEKKMNWSISTGDYFFLHYRHNNALKLKPRLPPSRNDNDIDLHQLTP